MKVRRKIEIEEDVVLPTICKDSRGLGARYYVTHGDHVMYLTAGMCSLQCYNLDTYEAEAMVPCTAEEALSALEALFTAARKIIKEAEQ